MPLTYMPRESSFHKSTILQFEHTGSPGRLRFYTLGLSDSEGACVDSSTPDGWDPTRNPRALSIGRCPGPPRLRCFRLRSLTTSSKASHHRHQSSGSHSICYHVGPYCTVLNSSQAIAQCSMFVAMRELVSFPLSVRRQNQICYDKNSTVLLRGGYNPADLIFLLPQVSLDND